MQCRCRSCCGNLVPVSFWGVPAGRERLQRLTVVYGHEDTIIRMHEKRWDQSKQHCRKECLTFHLREA